MLLGDLERFVDALLDCYRWHDDDELGETVALVQLEDRAQVDIRLYREMATFQSAGVSDRPE